MAARFPMSSPKLREDVGPATSPGLLALTPWANFSNFQVGALVHLRPNNILPAGEVWSAPWEGFVRDTVAWFGAVHQEVLNL